MQKKNKEIKKEVRHTANEWARLEASGAIQVGTPKAMTIEEYRMHKLTEKGKNVAESVLRNVGNHVISAGKSAVHDALHSPSNKGKNAKGNSSEEMLDRVSRGFG